MQKDKAAGFEVRENKNLKYCFGKKLIKYMSVVLKGVTIPNVMLMPRN